MTRHGDRLARARAIAAMLLAAAASGCAAPEPRAGATSGLEPASSVHAAELRAADPAAEPAAPPALRSAPAASDPFSAELIEKLEAQLPPLEVVTRLPRERLARHSSR